MSIVIKRIYEPSSKDDGIRILVDRLWPRGISKERADLDYWYKDVAPSTKLRKWFNHEPDHFKVFKEEYLDELANDENKQEELADILKEAKNHKVTLLYGAKSPTINHAIVLKEYLDELKV